MKVVGRDDRNRIANDAADQGQQGPFRIMVVLRQSGAVQDTIDTIQRPGGAQTGFAPGHELVEERLVHRSVGFRHGEQNWHRRPRPCLVHVRDEAWELTQHMGRIGTGVRHHRFTRQQGAGRKIGLHRDGREAIALDGKTQQGDPWSGQRRTPSKSAILGVAFRPLPVSTSTVVCSGVIVPEASSLASAAATWADVGST